MNRESFAIIRNSRGGAGKIIRLSESGELLCRKASGGGSFSGEELLSDSCTDFDVFTDDAAAAHIFFADRAGNLIYLRGSGEKWQRAAVVKAKDRGISGIEQVFAFKNRLLQIIIYTALKNGDKQLEMLTTGGGVPEIRTIGALTGKAFAAQAENGDIYLFFTPPKSGEFGLRVFYWSKKDWGEPLSLGIGKGADWLLPQTSGEKVNLCVKEGGELKFMQIQTDVGGQLELSEIQTLSRRHSRLADLPVIYSENGGLRLAWHENGKIYSTETLGGALRWSRLGEEDFSGGGVFTAKLCTAGENADRFDICLDDGGVRGYNTGEIFSDDTAASPSGTGFAAAAKTANAASFPNAADGANGVKTANAASFPNGMGFAADVFWGGSQGVPPLNEEIEQNKRRIMEMLKSAQSDGGGEEMQQRAKRQGESGIEAAERVRRQEGDDGGLKRSENKAKKRGGGAAKRSAAASREERLEKKLAALKSALAAKNGELVRRGNALRVYKRQIKRLLRLSQRRKTHKSRLYKIR